MPHRAIQGTQHGQDGRAWSLGLRISARPTAGSGQAAQHTGFSGTSPVVSGLSARDCSCVKIHVLPPCVKTQLPTPSVWIGCGRPASAQFLFGNPGGRLQCPVAAVSIITSEAQVRRPHLDHFLQVRSGTLQILDTPSSACGGEEGLPRDKAWVGLQTVIKENLHDCY